MKRSRLLVAVIVVAALTLLSGIIHGRMSNRWGPSPDLVAVGNTLEEKLPRQFGDWQHVATGEMSDTIVEVLQCTGYVVASYRDTAGETVDVAILVGPPGPISVHVPEICYSSREYAVQEARQLASFPVRPDPTRESEKAERPDDELWSMTFRSNDPGGDILRVYYAWSAGKGWTAAENPRFSFMWAPYLYKIQLAAHLPLGADPVTDDPCRRFLEEFLPAVRRALVAPTAR